MGIFDFLFKKDTPQQTDHQAVQTNSGQPIESVPAQKVKNTIADFFNIDILNLNPEDYEERAVLDIDNPELGMFQYADGHISDGKVNNIEFVSLSKKFTPEFVEFVNRCAATFGPTSCGEGEITQKDSSLLRIGRFSRMWHDVWIDCGPDDENGGLTAVRLTIFNVAENGKIQLKLK